MQTPTEKIDIDKRIHRFRASKSPWKTFSKTIAARLSPSMKTKSSNSDISYEPLDWNHTEASFHPRLQKAH